MIERNSSNHTSLKVKTANVKLSSQASPVKLKAETTNIMPSSQVSPVRLKAETANIMPSSQVSPVKLEAETANIMPSSQVSPVKLEAETANIMPSSQVSPVKLKTETANIMPSSQVSPVKIIDEEVNIISKPSNHTSETTELTSRRRTRKRKLIAPRKCDDLRGKYQELYSTITDGERLTDRHIDAANQLLSDKFPNIQGLCTPLLGQKLQYPVYNCFTAAAGFSYVQIIHCPVFEHWITIEISFDEEVRIFDSLFVNKLSYEVKKQIASIVQTKHNQIELKLEKTQQQQNATDCGIFAIAFATDLCHGIDPVRCNYSDGNELRHHFLKCLQEGIISPFPKQSIANRKPLLKRMNIYCKCRLPYILEHKKKKEISGMADDIKMIYCDCCQHWFHLTCVNVKGEFSSIKDTNTEWICDECATSFDLFSDQE